MSALNPKVSLLVKLGQMVRFSSNALDGESVELLEQLLKDSEVLEWYDRMAELKYVPTRIWVEGARPTPEMIADARRAGPPSTYVQDRLLAEAMSSKVGYQICATRPANQIKYDKGEPEGTASYTEARSPEEALESCRLQFPEAEGYSAHYVKNIETQEVYSESEITSVPALSGEDEAQGLLSLVEPSEGESGLVLGLSLEEDEAPGLSLED